MRCVSKKCGKLYLGLSALGGGGCVDCRCGVLVFDRQGVEPVGKIGAFAKFLINRVLLFS